MVSVVIPVHSAQEGLGPCLEALRLQTYPFDAIEIIVVDNLPATRNSHDARNAGAGRARGEILAFTNADCRPEPEWIQKGVAHLLHTPDCGLVAGKIEVGFADPTHPTAPELYDRYAGFQQAEQLKRQHFGVTANLFTFRSVFETVGPFRPDLGPSADVEWGQRVFAAGYRQVFAAAALVHHQARKSLPELIARCRLKGQRLRLAMSGPKRLHPLKEFGTSKMIQVFAIACLLRFVEWAEWGRGHLRASPAR